MTAYQNRRQVSLRISVTDRCQLRCGYCMPLEGVAPLPRNGILSFEEIVRFVRVVLSGFELRQVRLTGGEPLLRRGIVELVARLAELEIPDLTLTTNGQLLAELAPAFKSAGLSRVNVSLDSINSETYRAITRGGELNRTLAGINAALRAGLTPVKLNMVVMRGLNDQEVTGLAQFGLARGCHVRFLELMPIGCAKAEFAERFVPAAEIRSRLESVFQLTPLRPPVADYGGQAPFRPDLPGRAPWPALGHRRAGAESRDGGGSSRDFVAVDSQGLSGVIGLIAAESEPFCLGCARLRLTSTGELIACLARPESVAIRQLLRSDAPEARQSLLDLAARQVEGKCVRTAFATTRAMVSVGG